MADVKISELDEAATIGSNDSLVGIQGVKTKRFKIGKLLSAENISFDNTGSGLSANQVQAAITEVNSNKVPVCGMGKNLLDNWYFGNPVNQRGSTTYSGVVKMIDRWYGEVGYSQLQVTADGVKVYTSGSGHSAIVTQNVNGASNLLGSTVMLSGIVDGSLVSGSATIPSTFQNATVITAGSLQLYMTSSGYLVLRMMTSSTSGIVVKAVKLELGTQQTLAHLEGSTLVLNEIPNYGEELVKCQTSTADSSDTYANKTLAARQDLASLQATGSTNATGAAITAGTYFYLNGELVQAIGSGIASGAAFTLNTNYKTVTAGGLNDIEMPKYISRPIVPSGMTNPNYQYLAFTLPKKCTSAKITRYTPFGSTEVAGDIPLTVGSIGNTTIGYLNNVALNAVAKSYCTIAEIECAY